MNRKLNIGLDFDNTIIDYDRVFYQLAIEHKFIDKKVTANKSSVKNAVVARFGNDKNWQLLQSLAYGEKIADAVLFKGVKSFILNALEAGHSLSIVSHKSRYSNYDSSVELRKYARMWMQSQGIVGTGVIEEEKVYFLETLDDKVLKISDLEFDIFIDDLDKVLQHKLFPRKTLALAFSPLNDSNLVLQFKDWQDIFPFINSEPFNSFEHTLKSDEILAWFQLEKSAPKLVERIDRDGNNQILKLVSRTGKPYLLKRYFQSTCDRRNRGEVEFEALLLMKSHGFDNVPNALYFSSDQSFAFYEYIEQAPLENDANELQKAQAISAFCLDLKSLYDSIDCRLIAEASDSRQCYASYFEKIESRLALIEKGCEGNELLSGVESFVRREFIPFKNKVFDHAKTKLYTLGFSLEEKFSHESRTLSPSDLGPHNMLTNTHEKSLFIDFEYFGLDDPAKMLADIYFHAQDNLSLKSKYIIYQSYTDKYPEIVCRFNIIADLIAIEWLLIILNVANPDSLMRRRFANPSLDEVALLEQRLSHAKTRLLSYQEVADLGGQFLTLSLRKS